MFSDKPLKILIITSGQPSLNPRLVKEADALTNAGYDVTVLYAYWNDWGTIHDKQLLPQKKWKAIRIGGDPDQKKFIYLLSRIIHKLAKRGFGLSKGRYFADFAIARSSYFLIRAAKKQQADLYIGHNLGALGATVKAAKSMHKLCGFDAEDFHRQEVSDDIESFHYKLCSYIENKYLPLVNYLTAASPQIGERYADLYNRKVTGLLNVFPKTPAHPVVFNETSPLNLFWFSQNIGPKRGIEIIIEAMALSATSVKLHLLGNVSDDYKQNLLQLAQSAGVEMENMLFYEPVEADSLFDITAKFDIGLASETGFCLNNSIALSNKLFTYLQSGIAVVASATSAQSSFMSRYPQIGSVYKDAKELAAIITRYNRDRKLLLQTKLNAYEIGQEELNWENESLKLLEIVKNTLQVNTSE